MFILNNFVQIVIYAILLLGVLSLCYGAIKLIAVQTTQKVSGRIVDYVQEYTARGFLWKAKVEYIWNNQVCFHIMRARTAKRGSDDVTIHVNKRGRVVETGHAIESIVFGLFAIVLAVMLLTACQF